MKRVLQIDKKGNVKKGIHAKSKIIQNNLTDTG